MLLYYQIYCFSPILGMECGVLLLKLCTVYVSKHV